MLLIKNAYLIKKNTNKFIDKLRQHDFQELYNITNVNDATDVFHNTFSVLYEECFPLKVVKRKYSCKKPWLSEALKVSIKRKNTLYKRYLKNPSSDKENEYKSYRNKLNHVLRIAEREHYFNLITFNKSNLKKTWSIMKSIINKKVKSKNADYFMQGSLKITDKEVIASKFNDFFVNVGVSLSDKIPQSSRSAQSYLTDSYTKTLFLTPVNRNELINVIKQLKTNTSSGWDDLSPKILQMCHLHILDPLLHIVNLSLNQGIFPDKLKLAKVVPLFKGNEIYLFTNYRPISILNCFSKIFERVFYNRLYNFLNSENILYDKQFGFRKSFSTEIALTLLLDRITCAIEQGEFVLGVFLDFSKAFDTVNHSILLSKLYYYGIRGVANDWLKSYLTNRKQFVVYDNVKSSEKTILCGVPQGSILGPLLFLIYINDLTKISNVLYTVMYADDTNIFISGKCLRELETIMNRELLLLNEWLFANKLSLNVNKTHFMIICPPKVKLAYNINLKINNCPIYSVQHTQFLGVILDSKLSWKPHIKHVATKLSKNLGILNKARRHLDMKSLNCLYYAFLYPYFTYCISIWGGTNVTTLQPLIKLQKWAVKTISCKPKRTASSPLFKSLRILTIRQIYDLQVLTFMYKYKKSLLPSVFNSFYITTSTIHHHYTRQHNNYYLPRCRLDLTKSFIKYSGCHLWNALDNTIKSFSGSVSLFKKQIIKQWF